MDPLVVRTSRKELDKVTDIGSDEETEIAECLRWPFLREGDLLRFIGARSRRSRDWGIGGG